MHTKQVKYNGFSALCYIRDQLGARWVQFEEIVKQSHLNPEKSGNSDGVSINLQYIVTILRNNFNLPIQNEVQAILHKAFGAKSEQQARKVEIEPILNVKDQKSLRGAYERV